MLKGVSVTRSPNGRKKIVVKEATKGRKTSRVKVAD
jgi:hypothetical protein